MGVFKMEWKTWEEVCGWVGFHHFLLTMIFGSLGIWIVIVERGGNFWTLWKLIGFFVRLIFILFFFFFIWQWCYYIFQGRCSKKKSNIFCYLNFKHYITNFCSYYCCCKIFDLLLLLLLLLWLFWNRFRNNYVRKMSTTKMSYLQTSN